MQRLTPGFHWLALVVGGPGAEVGRPVKSAGDAPKP